MKIFIACPWNCSSVFAVMIVLLNIIVEYHSWWIIHLSPWRRSHRHTECRVFKHHIVNIERIMILLLSKTTLPSRIYFIAILPNCVICEIDWSCSSKQCNIALIYCRKACIYCPDWVHSWSAHFARVKNMPHLLIDKWIHSSLSVWIVWSKLLIVVKLTITFNHWYWLTFSWILSSDFTLGTVGLIYCNLLRNWLFSSFILLITPFL